jgi:hypothetical protein
MKPVNVIVGAVSLFALHTVQAFAADLSPAPVLAAAPLPPEWTFSVNSYVWAAGLKGRMRTIPPLPAVNIELSFQDIIKNLDGAIMGAFDARKGRFVLLSDLMIARVSADKQFAVAGFPGTVGAASLSFVGLAAAGYSIVYQGPLKVDIMAGVRGFNMSNALTLRVGGVSTKFANSEAWVDGVVGTRIRYDFNNNFFASAIGFVGGGQSKYEWELLGGLGYKLNDRYSAFAGYRVLKVDYRSGSFVYNAIQKGPMIGLKVSF